MIAIKQKEAKEKSFFYYFRPKEEDSEEQKSYEDLVKEDIKRMKSFPNVEDNNTAKPKEEENNRDERGLINFLIYSCFGLYCLFMILYFINKKFSKKGRDK